MTLYRIQGSSGVHRRKAGTGFGRAYLFGWPASSERSSPECPITVGPGETSIVWAADVPGDELILVVDGSTEYVYGRTVLRPLTLSPGAHTLAVKNAYDPDALVDGSGSVFQPQTPVYPVVWGDGTAAGILGFVGEGTLRWEDTIQWVLFGRTPAIESNPDWQGIDYGDPGRYEQSLVWPLPCAEDHPGATDFTLGPIAVQICAFSQDPGGRSEGVGCTVEFLRFELPYTDAPGAYQGGTGLNQPVPTALLAASTVFRSISTTIANDPLQQIDDALTIDPPAAGNRVWIWTRVTGLDAALAVQSGFFIWMRPWGGTDDHPPVPTVPYTYRAPGGGASEIGEGRLMVLEVRA